MRRRLDTELVRRGLAPSRTRAVQVIRAGRVLVAGAPAAAPARQVGDHESIAITGEAPRFVSRGGDKLAGALERLPLDVRGRRALDAGAGHGGFTDCLLQSGVTHVVTVDVGRGQLAWSLRDDPRVTVVERTNVRDLQPADIGGCADVCTADLSFISLRTVAPALVRCTTAGADLALLVKPQFEAGREQVGKGGVVRDPEVHEAVLLEVSAALAQAGLSTRAVVPSPLRGTNGNIEFFLHCRPGDGWTLTLEAVALAVAEAHAA